MRASAALVDGGKISAPAGGGHFELRLGEIDLNQLFGSLKVVTET